MSAVYYTYPQLSPELDHALASYDPLTRTLLAVRGITTEVEAERFFLKDYEQGMHDPFLMPGMEEAVTRILAALTHKEHITIYSDYDCDGIPGGALLHDFFKALGYAHFDNYIPHRHTEGYGLNEEALAALVKRGTKLVITVDCGITDVAEVAYAQERGLDVIVTDHHEPGEVLPPAVAVLNPKRKDTTYPFRELCGSGVAFKLIQALIARGACLPPGKEKWLLDVVGLATIADMVPLVDENRLFAHYGLVVMKKGRRLGLQHLFKTMRMRAQDVTEDDIGFMIGPRINAASRMGAPTDAFLMLTAETEAHAGAQARHLERINNERKGVVGAMVKEVKRKLAARTTVDAVMVLGDPAWRPALVGLAANTLMEEYNRPVFLWGRDGRGVLKGSCRSSGRPSVVDLMRHAHDSFLEYGGHHASGGFAVREEKIHTLGSTLQDAYALLAATPHTPAPRRIDGELSLDAVTSSLMHTLCRFAPFGIGNEKPLFILRVVTPLRVELFGKEKAHTKAYFRRGSGSVTAIGFFKRPDEYPQTLAVDTPVDLVAHVEESTFGGMREIRLRIVDVLPPGSC